MTDITLFFWGHILGILFGGFIVAFAMFFIKGKNIDNRYMRKWRSLAQKYEDALLDIRGILLTALLKDEENAPDASSYMNALDDIHQTIAKTLWGKEK